MKFLLKILFVFILTGFITGNAQTWDELNTFTIESFKNGDYDAAITYGEKALKLAIKQGGKQGRNYAASLSNLAYAYKNKGEYEKSLSYFQEALTIREKLGGKLSSDYVITLNGLGVLYHEIGKYEESEKCLLDCLEIGKQMDGEKSAPYAQFLNSITLLYKTMGKYDLALKYGQEALNVIKISYGEDHSYYSTSLSNIGSIYNKIGDYVLAEKTYLKAMEYKKKAKKENTVEYGVILNNIAEVYDRMGYNDKAESCYLQSLSIFEMKYGKDHPDYALNLNNLGLFYLDERRFKEAEAFILEALEIRKKFYGINHPELASSLNALGSLYHSINNFTKAEEYFLQALEIRKTAFGNNHPSVGIALNNLAGLYLDEMRLDDAKSNYLKCLEISIGLFGEEHEDVASCVNNLAETYVRLLDYVNAEKYFHRALKIREKLMGKESEDVSATLMGMASMYARMGEYTKSEDLLLRSIQIRKKIYGDQHSIYKQSINHLIALYLRSNSLSKAIPYLSICVDNFTNDIGQLSTFLSEDELERYMVDQSADLDVYHSMVWQSDNSFPQANPILLDMSLFVRGIQLRSSESLKRDIFNSNDTTLISTYNKWIALKSQIAHQLSLPVGSRTNQLDTWISTANSFEKSLVRGSGIFKTEQVRLNLEWKRVRDKLKPDEAAVEFVSFQYYNGHAWTDSVFYFAMVVKSGDSIPSYIKLFEEQQLRGVLKGDSIKTFANLLYTDAQIRSVDNHDISYGDSLYQLIWKPIETGLAGIKKVYYSPSGLLHYLTFDAVPKNSQTTLSDLFKLQRVTSIGKIAEEKQAEVHLNSIAIYGGLDYNADTTQLKPRVHGNDQEQFDYVLPSIEDTTNRGETWVYLPGTKKELIGIQQLFEKNQIITKGYADQIGTEESFKALDGSASPTILHLSTHGFFFPNPELRTGGSTSGEQSVFQVSENPLLRSGLILSGANYVWNGGKHINGVEDGILTAYEVSNLYLPNTRLVVMSACETGLGDLKGSEGVYGLQRSFKMAGVDYIIVTLWQVLDKETSEFMIMFYEDLLKYKSIPEAFYSTQSKMKEKYRDEPYKWAGFVLIN